ncbi:GtrA family protein [Gilvimarinus algae]|uniref:GtrA family protein n=1 Tax=Gilvimarinus algae TaxID=3058037 RepID=A0ABT8TBU7_9GAMM|nr:GtrA family protein [Gilvimarinus sp. SDUM040014]MDO3381574.1 GtrA family protein [Gilvimarinus sp. SDUM040014]
MITTLEHWGAPFSRFMVTGLILGSADVGVFCALLALGVACEWANVAGLALGYCLGLVLHHNFTFRCNEALGLQSAQKYLLIFLLSLALGSGVLAAALALTAMPLVAKAASMATVAVSNFVLGRRFVFDL